MTALLHRLWRDRRGVAAVEAAVVISFVLLPLTAGLVGSGMAMLEQARVDRALHAGLMAAWGTPTASPGIIQTAAIAGYGPYSPNVTAAASTSYYCLPPTGTRASGTVASGSTATCPNGQVLGGWVTVTASTTFTPIFISTWGSAAWTLSATGTARVQ